MPSMTGICRSMRKTLGCSSLASATASSPLLASPTRTNWGSRSTNEVIAWRMRGISSTTMTEMGSIEEILGGVVLDGVLTRLGWGKNVLK